MNTIIVIAGIAAGLALMTFAAACAKRWAASLQRRRDHLQEFFKHANGVYDEAMQPVPDAIRRMLNNMAEGAMDKHFADAMIYVLTTRAENRRPSTETRREIDAAAKILTQKQGEHFVRAMLHAGLASAECSGVFGAAKADVFIALLENPLRAKEMTQKVVRFDWTNDDHHLDGNHAHA